jgi:hypothetical protein
MEYDAERFIAFWQDKRFREFWHDEEGRVAIEWLLVIGGLIIPIAALIFKVATMIAHYYAVSSWVISLPF